MKGFRWMTLTFAMAGLIASFGLWAALPPCSSQAGSQIPPAEVGVLSTNQAVLPSAPVGTAYITATWNDSSVHFLDADMNDLGSFPTCGNPNGIATDGTHIFVGSFGLPGVYAYDMDGNFLYQWSSGYCSYLQGLEYVDGALAVASDPTINFLDPASGAFLRSIPDHGSGVEGLAYDGTYLWELDDQIVAVDPSTGAVVRSISNAAYGCNFTGTGITASGPGELTLACAGGTWYKVSSADGSVISSGNNGLSMFGLKRVGSIGPSYNASYYDDYGRSQFCVNSKTGAYRWNILGGAGAGTSYTGTVTVFNGGGKYVASSPNYLSVTVDPVRHKASGWFVGGGFYSKLADANTLNDPPGCEAPVPALR